MARDDVSKKVAYLQRLGGRDIKVVRIRGTDNVRISGGGYKPVVTQVGTTVGISAETAIKARKRVIAKRKTRKEALYRDYESGQWVIVNANSKRTLERNPRIRRVVTLRSATATKKGRYRIWYHPK